MMRRICTIGTVAFVLAGLTGLVRAGSKVYVGKEHSAGRLLPLDQIDHGPWDRLLKEYVDQEGLVDYARWKASRTELAALDRYLAALGRGNLAAKTSGAGKLAFWINAYNAVTVRGILREYPTSSIRNHTAKLWGYNIWHDLLLWVGNQGYSLDTMEHKILRKMGDPRIHFAIVCASIDCPRLRNEAYSAPQIDAQLADNTRDFFSRPAHFRLDRARRSVYVSPILKWFSEDFGPTPQQGLAALADYLPSSATSRWIEQGKFSVAYLGYDWGLNDRRRAAKENEEELPGR